MYKSIEVLKDLRELSFTLCKELGCEFHRYHKTNDHQRLPHSETTLVKHINGVEFELFGDKIQIFPQFENPYWKIQIVLDYFSKSGDRIHYIRTLMAKKDDIENEIYKFYFKPYYQYKES
jgi:hypothetical protein